MQCQLQEEEEDKKARRKRDKLRSALTRPLGPADPQHKGTSLHLRMTYRECTEDQVKFSRLSAAQKTERCSKLSGLCALRHCFNLYVLHHGHCRFMLKRAPVPDFVQTRRGHTVCLSPMSSLGNAGSGSLRSCVNVPDGRCESGSAG